MRYLDYRSGFFLLVSALFIGVVIYQHQAVLASIAQGNDHSRKYLIEKSAAQEAVEDMQHMQEYYPVLQAWINDHRVLIRQEPDSAQELTDAGSSAGSATGGSISSSIHSPIHSYGAHRKVSWIKLFQSAKDHFELSQMSFEIYPYQLVAGELKDSLVSVGAESVTLRVSLLHDGVLAELMAYLREQAPVPFVVSLVEIERLVEPVEQVVEKPIDRLTAEITLKWHLIAFDGERGDIAS